MGNAGLAAKIADTILGNTPGRPAQQGGISPQTVDRLPPKKDLKKTDPDWKEHLHDVLDMFGNIPFVGTLFNAINAGLYIAEGDIAGATQALVSVVADLIPGGGEAASSVKIGEDLGKLAEKAGLKVGEKDAVKAGEKVAEKEAAERVEQNVTKKGENEINKQKEQPKNHQKDSEQTNKNNEENDKGGQSKKDKEKECKNNKGKGNPVNPLTGVKFLTGEEELDFQSPAVLPLRWQRNYFSDLQSAGWLGQGWSLPISPTLKRKRDALIMVDVQGNEVRLPTLELGERKALPQADFYACWEDKQRFRLSSIDGGTHFVFGSLGKESGGVECIPLICIEDRFQNSIRILYDDAGLPMQIHDAAGRVIDLEFASVPLDNDRTARRLMRVMLGTQALVSYVYSSEGDLVQVKNEDGQVTREYRYINHMMTWHSQPGALAARYTYDEYTPKGKVLSIENNVGQCWKFRYLADRTEVTNPLEQKEWLVFNENKVVVESIDAAGNSTRTAVDGRGNALQVTDASGRTKLMTYDMRGNVTSTTDEAGHRTEILHDPVWRRPTLIVDEMGATTRFEYDSTGNLVRTTDALGHSTQYVHDRRGQIIEIIDARGGRRTAVYNESGQMISQTDCSNQTTRYRWDGWGNLCAVINALGETTRYWRDRKGRLLKMQLADGGSETYTYDVHGRLIEHVDGQGARTRWELTADGLPSARVNALGHRLQYEYDAARRLTVLTNENGAQYRFAYDTAGNLIEERGFDGRVIRYQFDAAGLLIERMEVEMPDGNRADVRDSEGVIALRTRNERDATGRVTATTTTRARDGRSERTTWRYDAAGRLIETVNACCRLKLGYDAMGRLISETTETPEQTFKVAYDHDELGNHIRTTLPDGRQLNYLYYGSGHLHQINIDGEVISDIERDALHREVSRTQGRLTSHYQYDISGRFIGQRTVNSSLPFDHAIPVISRTYDYDRVGNVTRVTDQHGGSREYRYDPLGQLVQADREIFSFDPAHNMLDGASARPLVDNRVLQFSDRRYVYDAQGNMIEKMIGSHTKMNFEYSLANQIERVRINNVSGDTEAVYGYDALRRRVFKRNNAGTIRFVWEGNRLLCEIHEGRMFVYVYEHNSFVPLAQIESVFQHTDLI
jgi:YD repeat-containing protein